MKKTSVGIVFLTEIESMGGVVAILQARGEFNHEKMGPESWPGVCQITAHGRAEKPCGNDMGRAELYREIGKELGQEIRSRVEDSYADKMVLLVEKRDDAEEVYTYGLYVENWFLAFIKLNASSGGLRFITQPMLQDVRDIYCVDKVVGVEIRTINAMFPDEKEAVRLAFEKIDEMRKKRSQFNFVNP